MAGVHLQKSLYPADRKDESFGEIMREKMSSRGQCSHGYGVCHAAVPHRAVLHPRTAVGVRGSILGGWCSTPRPLLFPIGLQRGLQ